MKFDPRFPRLHIVDHPLVQHKLSLMRDKRTSTRDFRELLTELAILMGYELTRDFPVALEDIETPVAKCKSPMLSGKKCVIVPVLRAGLGMSDGLLTLMPSARVGHIGLYRDENHRPVEYMVKLPDLDGRTFIVVDPMVATGYSGAHAVDVLKKRGVPGDSIRFMALVAAPEGVEVSAPVMDDGRAALQCDGETIMIVVGIIQSLDSVDKFVFGYRGFQVLFRKQIGAVVNVHVIGGEGQTDNSVIPGSQTFPGAGQEVIHLKLFLIPFHQFVQVQ